MIKTISSTEEFVRKAKEIHGDKYDYSKAEYVKQPFKTTIICKEHGEFSQKATMHLRGNGCGKCFEKRRGKTRLLTLETIIQRFHETHGDRYDYSLFTSYVNSKTKIPIICRAVDHGVFEQLPYEHSTGSGCPRCAKATVIEKMNKIAKKMREDGTLKSGKKPKSREKFIEDAVAVHGDFYDYSLVEYKRNDVNVMIICNIENHGKFTQLPTVHLCGGGCPKCASKKISDTKIFSQDDAIANFKKVHGNKYDYSRVVYTGNRNKIKIRCIEHNFIFDIFPSNHARGAECAKCAKVSGNAKHKETNQNKRDAGIKPYNFGSKEQFIANAEQVHGKRYDYSKVEYKGILEKIEIICPKHKKSFWQLPTVHIGKKRGCPICGKQISHMSTQWLDSLNVPDQFREYRLPEMKTRPMDGYDPKTNTVYQFHGDFYHGNPILYDENDINRKNGKTYGYLYSRTCEFDQQIRDHGYNLIIMWEYDWLKTFGITKTVRKNKKGA